MCFKDHVYYVLNKCNISLSYLETTSSDRSKWKDICSCGLDAYQHESDQAPEDRRSRWHNAVNTSTSWLKLFTLQPHLCLRVWSLQTSLHPHFSSSSTLGNSMLVGIPAYLLRILQSALKAAAQLIFCLRRSDHITDALVSLHWLRVPERIQFEIAMLTYRVTQHSTWGRLPLQLMSLIDGHCVLPEPIGWLCLHLDCPPLVAELFQLPPLKSGTLYRNTSSQPPQCSPSGIT